MAVIGAACAGLLLVSQTWRTPPLRAVLRRRPIDEAAVAGSVSSALRSGRSVRQALIDAVGPAASEPDPGLMRELRAGRPLESLASRFATVLPATGGAVGAAVSVSATTGGSVAGLFDAIADRERQRVELRRSLDTATVQARTSAVVVGGLPLAATVLLLVTGRLSSLISAGGLGATAVVAGIAMQALGLAAIALLIKSRR